MITIDLFNGITKVAEILANNEKRNQIIAVLRNYICFENKMNLDLIDLLKTDSVKDDFALQTYIVNSLKTDSYTTLVSFSLTPDDLFQKSQVTVKKTYSFTERKVVSEDYSEATLEPVGTIPVNYSNEPLAECYEIVMRKIIILKTIFSAPERIKNLKIATRLENISRRLLALDSSFK